MIFFFFPLLCCFDRQLMFLTACDFVLRVRASLLVLGSHVPRALSIFVAVLGDSFQRCLLCYLGGAAGGGYAQVIPMEEVRSQRDTCRVSLFFLPGIFFSCTSINTGLQSFTLNPQVLKGSENRKLYDPFGGKTWHLPLWTMCGLCATWCKCSYILLQKYCFWWMEADLDPTWGVL